MSLPFASRYTAHRALAAICLSAGILVLLPIACLGTKKPGLFQELMDRAKLMRQVGQRQEAVRLYRRAVAVRPRSSEAHAKLGYALYEIGELDEAIREEQKAISLDRKNANAYHHLGTIYLRLNMLPEAADQFRMSLSLDPKKNCNCGPLQGLLMAHPPRTKDSMMTPQEADKILSNPPPRKALPTAKTPSKPNSALVK